MEPNLQAQFSEIDLLTGCRNLVSFSKGIDNNFGNASLSPMTLIGINVYQLRRINRAQGFERGDQMLRWLGIALRDEMGNVVYRIAGEAFVVVLTDGSRAEHDARARHLFERLDAQAEQLNMETPVIMMAVIHFDEGTPLTTALVWKNLNELMESIDGSEPFRVFNASVLQENYELIHAIDLMAERILSLGYMLNVTFRLAYMDPVGNLPNLIATRRTLDLMLAEASAKRQTFSMFLIDGDDLKRYNTVSYAAGDRLIGQIGSVLISTIRPDDFVGRWRFGDEFIVILPETAADAAVDVADRIRATTEMKSKSWMFPTTVSIGVVQYPQHGTSIDELMESAEAALKSAKEAGKNRTMIAA